MPYEFACTLDDLWEGEMMEVELEHATVLLVHTSGGHIGALEPRCPHQEFPLVQGRLDGGVLTCSVHLWQFDALSGEGINPTGCALRRYPTKVENGQVFVDAS